MKALQNNLVSPPVLDLQRQTRKYTLRTDACNVQVCCIRLQKQGDGTKRPIGYWSRSFNDAKLAYNIAHRKRYAIAWAVLLLRPYLEGIRFTIRTYQDSLQWILNLSDATGMLASWQPRLSEFDFKIVHR